MAEQTEKPVGLPNPERGRVAPHLTWDEFVFLSDQSWGLRHVTSQERAERELREGIDSGDAVSLAAPLNFIPPEALEAIGIDKVKYLPVATVVQVVPDEYKEQIVSNFEQAVRLFLEESAGLDIVRLATEETATKEVIARLTTTNFAFLMAKFQGADTPYDVKAYFGLGKCGKRTVSAEDMVSLIRLDGDGVEFGFSQEELDSALSREKFDRIKKSCSSEIWGKIVGVVRERKVGEEV